MKRTTKKKKQQQKQRSNKREYGIMAQSNCRNVFRAFYFSQICAASGKKREEQMSVDETNFISHLLQKYPLSNLEAMARDYKNYWQNTPLQIKKKIERFARVHPQLYKEHAKS